MVHSAHSRTNLHQISVWLGPKDKTAVLLFAAMAFGVALLRHSWADAVACALLGGIATAITLIDLRHFRIPDLLSLPLIPIGLFAAKAAGDPLVPRVLAMGAVWAVLTLTQRAFVALRGRSGLGSGDIKLMSAAAIWLEPSVLPTFVLAAAGTGLCEAWLRRAGFHTRIAFGAHLAPWLVVFVLAG